MKKQRVVTTMKLVRLATIPATIMSLLALAQPASAAVTANSGFYDHQVIEYQATAEVTSSPHAAQLISKGNIVFHIVGADGTTPSVQCAQLHPNGDRILGRRLESADLPLEGGRDSGGAQQRRRHHRCRDGRNGNARSHTYPGAVPRDRLRGPALRV